MTSPHHHPDSTPDSQAQETVTGGSGCCSSRGGPLSGGLGIFVIIVLAGTAVYLTYKTLTTAEPPQPLPIETTFMCAKTGKTFAYAMKEGEHWPVLSPHSNERTGYPAERCYWTKDGKRKKTPTYVILNESLGKPGDTICPDCGRIVVGHNPPPPADVPLAEEGASGKPAE